MSSRFYSYIPDKRGQPYSEYGSSPLLFDKLKQELEGATEVYAALFLFNNTPLLDALQALDCPVKIVSLPLSGYTNRTVSIDASGEAIRTSKQECATKVYNSVEQSKVELRECSHTSVWIQGATKSFARASGGENYSLHMKGLYVRCGTGGEKAIYSSCNFATGDPFHSESMLVIEDEPSCSELRSFLAELFNSMPPPGVSESGTIVSRNQSIDSSADCFFTSPYLNYNGNGSPRFANSAVKSFIGSATEELIIVAQHVHDVSPYDSNAESLVQAIAESKAKTKVILKQTRASELGSPGAQRRARQCEELLRSRGCQQRSLHPIIHDKIIIADNRLMFMSANITPAQYAWRDSDRFSYIESFVIIECAEVLEQAKAHLRQLWKKSGPIK